MNSRTMYLGNILSVHTKRSAKLTELPTLKDEKSGIKQNEIKKQVRQVCCRNIQYNYCTQIAY